MTTPRRLRSLPREELADFVKENVAPEEMIRPEDIAEAVRYLLRVSPACVVPEMMFIRPGDQL